MTVPPTIAPITPDDAIVTLVELAEMYERVGAGLSSRPDSKFAALYRRRAAALRWILELTAYPVEPGMPDVHPRET